MLALVCIPTFLALGDRHLDNLMMTDQGEIFHVDFGYILGKDPHEHKYTPPKKSAWMAALCMRYKASKSVL